jgi:hypothetical protein
MRFHTYSELGRLGLKERFQTTGFRLASPSSDFSLHRITAYAANVSLVCVHKVVTLEPIHLNKFRSDR